MITTDGGINLSYPADLHVHSKFSHDADDDLNVVCQAAINKGLKIICFTEHLDLDPNDPSCSFFNYPKFSKALESARREFGDRIEILKGIEFSEPYRYPREFEKWRRKDVDFILGSVHTLDRVFIGEKDLLKRYTIDQLFESYYHKVLQAVRFGGFDALAHLDFPKRYYRDTSSCPDSVSEILHEMVSQEIALEINTSPLRKGLPEPSPAEAVVRQFLDLGGQKITLGSDAHSAEDIGSGLDEAWEMIKKINPNFTGLGFFKKRQFIPLGNF